MKKNFLRLIPAALLLCLATAGQGDMLPGDIKVDKSLLILDRYVVETWSDATPVKPGSFTVEHLLTGIARDGQPKTALLEWLNSWQAVHDGRTVRVGRKLIDRWKALDNASQLSDTAWKPDFSHAPFRLLAIVYRPDLWREDRNQRLVSGGEGRFVFCVTEEDDGSPHTTINFEFFLPARNEADARAWAARWFALSRRTAFDDAYCRELAALTNRFTRRGAMPAGPHGSALGQIRTNERDISAGEFQQQARWNLQEFAFGSSGAIAVTTTKQTPDMRHAQSRLLVDYINQDETRILTDRHHVPETFRGTRFLGRQADQEHANLPIWLLDPSLRRLLHSEEALRRFSLNTCNGCHGIETRTENYHLTPRRYGATSRPSAFLRDLGKDGEMAERVEIMAAILNGVPADVQRWEAAAKKQQLRSNVNLPELLRKRAHRVH